MTNRHGELLARLSEGISTLSDSDEWRAWLNVQSRFHRYSWRNTMLISSQRPDATHVAGYRTWQGLGRQVRPGEHAVWIFAPLVYKRDSRVAPDSAGQEVRGFKTVPVFDVSQTEGQPLPQLCRRLTGDDELGYFKQLVLTAEGFGYRVEDADLAAPTNGDCTFELRRIRIDIGNDPIQRVKTLAHELAHALLHEHEEDPARAELEAESVAYCVCAALGIDSGDYSFGYLAGWAGGGDQALTALAASAERIQRTTSSILDVGFGAIRS